MRRRTALMWNVWMALGVGLAALGGTASAGLVMPTDLDGITLGASVSNPGPKNLISYVGQLDMEVFYNAGSGVYTYEIAALPLTGDATHLITPTNLYGFNGVAGWSYSDAVAAGGPGDATAWSIDWSGNKQLTWQFPAQEGGTNFLDSGESLRFFYQSTHAPINSGNHVMGVGLSSGTAFSGPKPQETAPIVTAIPEPGSWALCLIGWTGLARKRRR